MIWLPMASFAVGALLAQRFRVLVLLPATLVVALLVFGFAVAGANGVSSAILDIVLATVSMQAGYLIGLLAQRCTAAVRASRFYSFFQTTSSRDPAC